MSSNLSHHVAKIKTQQKKIFKIRVEEAREAGDWVGARGEYEFEVRKHMLKIYRTT